MRKIVSVLVISAATLATGYSLAQDASDNTPENPVAATPDGERNGRSNREPIDLEKFSRLDALKSADKDGDGTLSREEIEAHALDQLVKRMADRMERRLDINGDGAVTIEEIEKQRGKEFSALDRNEDGVLDRGEMRAAKQFRGPGPHHFGPRHSGPRR